VPVTPGLVAGLGRRWRRPPIDPRGARRARLARRLPENVLVDPMGPCRADPIGLMGGLRRHALALWGDGGCSHGLSRRSVPPLVRPGVACPPVGPVGLRSPPAPVRGAAQTATMPISGRCAWRSLPDPWPAAVAFVGSPAGSWPGERRPVPPGPLVTRSPSPGETQGDRGRSHVPTLPLCLPAPLFAPGGVLEACHVAPRTAAFRPRATVGCPRNPS